MRPTRSRVPFDPSPLIRLREARPEYVFLGDSMLDSRLDGPYLSQLLGGRPVSVIAPGGSATARWYLALKNYVIPSGARPRVVFLFFRDRYFSLPRFRAAGRYRSELEASMLAEEPVVRRLLDDPAGSGSTLRDLAERAYPVLGHRGSVREELHKLAAQLASSHTERDALIDRANARFAVRHLRPDLASELVLEEKEQTTPFSADPSASFLPHILEEANRHGLRLCLVRVKRRPDAGNARRQDPDLRRYVASLKAFVESSDHLFHDETDDPALGLQMYRDGDHLREDARRTYTAHFHGKLGTLFQ